jgi:hypothetical protein
MLNITVQSSVSINRNTHLQLYREFIHPCYEPYWFRGALVVTAVWQRVETASTSVIPAPLKAEPVIAGSWLAPPAIE